MGVRHRCGQPTGSRLGLCTDLYELRMVESYLKEGMVAPATFSLFIRPSAARPWYVALGVQRVLDILEEFRYGPEEIDYLATLGLGDDVLTFLASFAPTGQVRAVAEGSVVLANEPILEVTAPMPVAQVLETAVVNLVQYPTAVATKAARCRLAAGDRRLADFGFRRAHGLQTGVDAAEAAYVGGGFATSNVEAGRRHGIPVSGTMAHSYIQAFPDERDAFRTFARNNPDNTVLLVDTYDSIEGVRRAISTADELGEAGRGLQGVRLDSGDLGALARRSRELLDEAGYTDTHIFASGGVDEFRIHALLAEGAPIDAFGIGSSLATSQDHPALDIVYKLVDYDGRPVAKFSGVKSTYPGRKQVHRPTDEGPEGDVLSVEDGAGLGEPLLGPVWQDEPLKPVESLDTIRERARDELSRLPDGWRLPPYPEEPPLPRIGTELQDLSETVRRQAFAAGQQTAEAPTADARTRHP